MSFKLPLTNLQNVKPGNTATLKVDVGPGAPTFDQFKFALGGGLLPAHILSVVGKANGRIFMEENGGGTVINARDAYRNVAVDPGFVVIDFTERNARNGTSEQLVASVPGSLLKSLTFDLKLDAAAPAGSTMTASTIYRPPTSNPFIRKMLSTNQSFPALGTAGAPNRMFLPTGGAGGKIKRIWIRESVPGAVTAAQIRIANSIAFDSTRAEWELDQKRNLMVPQAGITVIDFIEDGNLAGMLDTSSAPGVELALVTNAAATFTVDFELVDPISRL